VWIYLSVEEANELRVALNLWSEDRADDPDGMPTSASRVGLK
jgi:hypothetical protein